MTIALPMIQKILAGLGYRNPPKASDMILIIGVGVIEVVLIYRTRHDSIRETNHTHNFSPKKVFVVLQNWGFSYHPRL